MAHGVSEVEEHALAGVEFVAVHHARLDLDAALDDGAQRLGVAGVPGEGLEVGEKSGVRDAAVFDDLGHAFGEAGRWQGLEHERIDDDDGGLVERPGEVLAERQVDARLAADRGVDLGEQGGRDLDDGAAAQVCGGGEAREVADDAAAERDDEV